MPRVKSAKSLSEICIDFILEIQDRFVNGMPTSKQDNGVVQALESEKSVINPFDGLPSNLLDEIFQLLRNKLNKKTPYQYEISPFLKRLLTTSNLRTLDFSRTKTDIHSLAMQSNILHQATIKSPHLKTLRLPYSFDCHYLNFISQFTKLQVLDISYSEAGNDCFQILGTNCPELRELNAKFSKVSDDGIRELCVTGKCKSISLLNLTGCQQCTVKAMQIALDNLLELKVLLHESLLEGLAEIAQNALDNNLQLPKYPLLSSLHVLDKTVYKSGSLRQSLILCPNVTKVYLSVKLEGLKDIDLLSLLSLEKLYVFVIRHYARKRINRYETDKDLTFSGGVAPLLKKFGSSLKTLSIEGFFIDVDIKVVIETCPNLKILLLTSNSYKTTSTTVEVRNKFISHQPGLKKLLTLCITSEDSCIPPEDLVMLLSSPSLTNFQIGRCNTLTDEILHRVVNINSFSNLELLVFCDCDYVSEKGIDNFMKETNPLRKIYISNCANMENVDEYNEKAIWFRKNWQFKLSIFR